MKTRFLFLVRWAIFGLLGLFGAGPALALLPDPGNIYYGLAKDVFGQPFAPGAEARVVMLRVIGTLDDPFDAIPDDDILIAESEIINPPGSNGLINYILRPSQDDGNGNNRYIASAVRQNDAVQLFIVAGGIRYPVASAGNCAPVSDTVPAIGARATVRQVNLRAIDDYDGNCMADTWERFYFGESGVDGSVNFDGDDYDTLAEFLAGTNPLLPDGLNISVEQSGLSIVRLSNNSVRVEWPRVPGRTYTLEWSTTLQSFTQVPAAKLSGANLDVIDVTGFTHVFVRVRVSK